MKFAAKYKHVAAREIALALGVPPMLLGIPGDNTYSNYQEATRTFWRSTVLPLVNRTAKSLSAWLAPAFVIPEAAQRPSGTQGLQFPSANAGSLELRPDLDAIEALSPEREALWARLEKATFLTPNEKRSAVGYGPLAGGDEIKRDANQLCTTVAPKANFNPGQLRDELGRWVGDGGGDSLVHEASRRRGGRREGTSAQEARHAAARAQAQAARRRVRELDPEWREPQSAFARDSIEGQIRHEEAVARAAEARLAEILRDAIPNANPSWGVNRLRSELYDLGFRLVRPTDSPGHWYRNDRTGEEVRIMERPEHRNRRDSREKYTFSHYYRYRPGFGRTEGAHTPIPDR